MWNLLYRILVMVPWVTAKVVIKLDVLESWTKKLDGRLFPMKLWSLSAKVFLFNKTCDCFWLKLFLVQNSFKQGCVTWSLFLTLLVSNKYLLHLIESFYLKMHLAACTSCNKLLSVIRLQNVSGSKKKQQLWWLFVVVMFYKFTANTESRSTEPFILEKIQG